MRAQTQTATTKRRFGILDRDKERKAAIEALMALRSLAKKAAADLSIPEYYANRLGHDLSNIEITLNEMLPPVGSRVPILRDLFIEEPETARSDVHGCNSN